MNYFSESSKEPQMFSLNSRGRLVSFSEPVVMGIINTTPDSFFEGSRKSGIDAVLLQAERMLLDGAAIIDIGGQSTRPGSTRVPQDEELKRVLPAIEALVKRFPDILISIDTYYSTVAKEGVAAGASIVNDVSAGTIDNALLPTVACLNVPYVLMHMQGTLETMQQSPKYDNIVTDVFDFFSFTLKQLYASGIKDVILDPGFGFGKNATHNFTLLKHLSYFKQFQKPILIGLSRKATVYKTLGISATEALNGTTVLNTISLMNGASILRVHDVKEAVEAIKLVQAYSKS
jgi:dihydropteroate synthase